MTAQDIISSSLRLIHVITSGGGDSLTADELNDGLSVLQTMLDQWQAERLNIFSVQMNEFTLTPGQQVYTLGAGGNFNMPRPARIEKMGIVNLNNPAQPLELPLEMLTHETWAAIPVKLIQSTLPQKCYDDGAFPLRNLNFWCVPSVTVKTRIYSWTPLFSFPDLNVTQVNLPPAYLKAIRYNLAVDLAPEFGMPVPPEVAMQAQSSKQAMKSLNTPFLDARCESAVSGTMQKPIYNWLTDGPAVRG